MLNAVICDMLFRGGRESKAERLRKPVALLRENALRYLWHMLIRNQAGQ